MNASAVALMFGMTVVCAASVQAEAEVVKVDFSVDRGPVTYRASGFLHAMSRTVPEPGMVEPLKPRMFRMRAHWQGEQAGAFGCYERVKKLGARLQLVVSDDTGYGRRGWLPGDDGDWKQWEDVVEGLVKEAQEKGYTFEWDIWNEPNIPGFWSADRDRFFETWRSGYVKIRSLDPRAVIVGPSLAYYSASWLEAFLLYAKENSVLPDVLSWHEMGGGKPRAWCSAGTAAPETWNCW